MVRWKLHSILFLMLLCKSHGQFQNSRRFESFDRYVDLEFENGLILTFSPCLMLWGFSACRFTLLASDLLRTDSQENIYLQADGLSKPVTVSVSIWDISRTALLLLESVTLNLENNFQALKTIQLSSDNLNRDEKNNKFVYLKVNFDSFHSEERVLMVSFHSGYLFIQTDKPIYNHGDTVRFRAFVSSPSFKAFDSSITIDIQNPDGVVVKHISRTKTPDGVFADTFPLSEIVNEGTWILTAKFDHWQQNTFTSQFEVKKYVLPAFNVTLMPRKSFLSLDDSELVVDISARYLYGEPVQGKAYVVFGVKVNKEMNRLPSVKQVSNLDGGTVTLSMEELKRAYPNIRSLVGNSVYVKVSVLTSTGSDLVEAEKTGIKIVESPYIVFFKDMPKYFKPGLPLDFTIQVSHHDGSPARNVPVKLNLLETPLVVSSGIARASINMPSDQRAQTITAESTQAGLRPEQQAKQQITVQPYVTFTSRQRNYLYISTGTNTVSVGDRLSLKLSISLAEQTQREFVKHITYLVLNKGKIITAERMNVTGQVVTSVGLSVTPEMMPSFRFVAFYSIPWLALEEVVSDSIWIDVADSCVGGLKVGPVDGIRRDYAPGKSFRFQIRGDPGAKVSLVAVDNAMYLLNKDRLTQRKVWDVVEHGDIGCTHGGGRDAKGVFSDAGLLYSSSTGFKTTTRQTLQCPGSTRRRRSAELLKRKAQLESLYKEKLQHRCCKDGLREIPMPYSCTRRSLYITEGWECIRAFRYCCATYRDQVFDTEIPTTPPTTTAAPTTSSQPWTVSHTSRREKITLSRYNFDWGRTLGAIPGQPGPPGLPGPELYMYTNVNKMAEEDILLGMAREAMEEEEEEEEWEYLDETEVYLRSKFYESWLWMDDVNLPSQADSNGLASKNVDTILPDSITEWGVLAVSSSPQTGFCVAEPYNVRAWKRFFVDLKLPHSVARNEQVEIKVVVHNYGYDDLHVRVVLMKTEGMCSIAFKDRHTQEVTLRAGSSVAVPYTIVPLVVGKLPLEVMVAARDMVGGDRIQKFLRVVLDGVQKTEVWSVVLNPSVEGGTQTVHSGKPELESVVPNSVPETFINVRGSVLADSIDNSISEDSLASLIRMPGGCVEQNLASITLPLISTLYLDRSNSWESVGVQRKAEAIRYIRRGYENQLAYRRSDGSYPPYRGTGASTWITAYVVKVFSMAHSIIGINQQQVCDPLLYLVKNKFRHREKIYVEDNPVYSTTMTGFARSRPKDSDVSSGLKTDITDNNPQLTHTASSYNSFLTPLGFSTSGLTGENPPCFTAGGRPAMPLLALGQCGDEWRKLLQPFKWLNSQRRRGGGLRPPLRYQHLSEYLRHKPPPDDHSLDGIQFMWVFSHMHFTNNLLLCSQLSANLDLEVEAQGNGQGILEYRERRPRVVTYYNQLHEVEEKMPCKHFDLNVTFEGSSEKPPADVEKSDEITIKVSRALGPRDVRMVVLDISLPTGFTPENSDLEMLSNSVDRYISNFQIVDNLSDRGSLIIHLFKVSHKEPDVLIFRLQQGFKVGLLQPSSVTVYEYYNPDHRCSRTYIPKENKEELTQICRDNVCRCTQDDCCVSKTDGENFPNKERETFACKSLHHVFQVKVLSVIQSYYDKYEMEITQVIKLGVEAGVEVGQKRFFMSHGGCRDGLSLKQGSQYLIIGPKEDQWNIDTDTNRFIYMLGKDTWVERWPLAAECSSSSILQNKCQTLNDAANELSVNACRL
uniref:Complement component c3b, tandem duplicate 2 n=2 Tax=Amphiprion ocellaris TaxID=80972 RepID=A0A3Q1ASV7_AMPOC